MVAKSKIIPKIVVIVGETASGKSDLAMKVARRFNGEIICADSKTTYKFMDIGTAKPSINDRNEIVHHMLDIVEPSQKYNASLFKNEVEKLITNISNRGKLPIMAGGSGLYIDSVIFDYEFYGNPNPSVREGLDKTSLAKLQSKAKTMGLDDKLISSNNKRYLIRAIETNKKINNRSKIRENTLILGINIPNEELKQKIIQRIDQMIELGFEDEVKQVVGKFGWDNEAMTGIGYKAMREYLEGKISLDEAKSRFIKGDIALAKKQRTWFKRNKSIQWVDGSSKALDFVQQFLNK